MLFFHLFHAIFFTPFHFTRLFCIVCIFVFALNTSYLLRLRLYVLRSFRLTSISLLYYMISSLFVSLHFGRFVLLRLRLRLRLRLHSRFIVSLRFFSFRFVSCSFVDLFISLNFPITRFLFLLFRVPLFLL